MQPLSKFKTVMTCPTPGSTRPTKASSVHFAQRHISSTTSAKWSPQSTRAPTLNVAQILNKVRRFRPISSIRVSHNMMNCERILRCWAITRCVALWKHWRSKGHFESCYTVEGIIKQFSKQHIAQYTLHTKALKTLSPRSTNSIKKWLPGAECWILR